VHSVAWRSSQGRRRWPLEEPMEFDAVILPVLMIIIVVQLGILASKLDAVLTALKSRP